MKNAARLLLVTAVTGTVSILSSCSGGGSGGGAMYVESCTLGCTNGRGGEQVSCGIVNTYQNQDVAVVFSQPVASTSLTVNNAFQVIDIVTAGFPAGSRLVDPNDPRRAIFRPRLSFDASGNPSYGFGANQTYQIRIPGTSQGDVGPYVQSSGGQQNQSRMLCTITTSQGLIDPVPGAPGVSIFVRTIGGGDPINLATTTADVVDVLSDSEITFVFNDLMNIGTLVQPSTGQSPFITVKVDPDGNLSTPGDQVPVGGTYTFQSPDQTNLTTTMVFTPFGGFPSAGSAPVKRKIVVDVPVEVKDLAGNSVSNPGKRTFTPEVANFGAITLPSGGEQFTDDVNEDKARSGANWGAGRLSAGTGGGSGRLGDLVIDDNQSRTVFTSPQPAVARIKYLRNVRGTDAGRFMIGNNLPHILYKLPANAQPTEIPIRTFLTDTMKETVAAFRNNPTANPLLSQLSFEIEGTDTIVVSSATAGAALNGARLAAFPDFVITLVGSSASATADPLDTNWVAGGGGFPYFTGALSGGLDNGLGVSTTAGALINNLNPRLFLTNLTLNDFFAATPVPVVSDGQLDFTLIDLQSNSTLTARGDNSLRLLARGLFNMADTAIIDVAGSDLGAHPSEAPIGQLGSRGGPGAGRGGQGADRPDDTGTTFLNLINCTGAATTSGPCGEGIASTAQTPVVNAGVLNPGAVVNGRAGQGVGGSAGFGGSTDLGDGTGGSRWPLSFPTGTAFGNFAALDTNSTTATSTACQSPQIGATGAGGAYATDGTSGTSVSLQPLGVGGSSSIATTATVPGASSELGLESTSGDPVTFTRRALRPSLGFLRGGSGGGGGGSGLFGTHTNSATLGSVACLAAGTAIDRYRTHSGAGGGGGGGAIQIAAGRILSLDGRIDATGGEGGDALPTNVNYGQHAAPGGGGSGGAILLQSKVIDLSPIQNRLNVSGGAGGNGPVFTAGTGTGGNGGTGLVRIEDDALFGVLDQPTAAISVTPADLATNSTGWLSLGDWTPSASGDEAYSGAQSCWMRATGNFFNLTFESDSPTELGWDMDVILDLGAGEQVVSYRESTVFAGSSPQQNWGSLYADSSVGAPLVSPPVLVRFQGAKAVGNLTDPCNVDVTDISVVAQNSLTPWVQHPDEFNSNLLAIKPDMVRFQIVFNRAHPDFALLRGVKNLAIRVVPD